MTAGGIEGEDPDATVVDDGTRGLRRALNVATLGSVANMALGVISALVISRIYGAAILGEYALAFAAVALLPVATSLSEQAAVVRLLALEPPRGERGSALMLATLTLSYALTLVIAPLVALGFGVYLHRAADLPSAVVPMVCLVAGYVVMDKLSWNLDGVLSAYVAAGPLAIASLLNFTVMTTAAILLALAEKSLWSLTIAYLLSSAVALGYRLWAVRPYLRWRVSLAAYRSGLKELPGIVRFGLRLLPGSISQQLTSQSPLWVLGATAPVAAVGAFSRAQSITVRIGDLNYRLAAVIYPSLVRRTEVDDGGKSFVADVVATLGRTFAPVLVLLCAAAGASRTVLSLFGQDFVSADVALAILLVATAISMAAMIFGEALTALNRGGTTSWGFVLGLVATLACLVPLTRSYGAGGAALAFLAGILVCTVFLFVALVRAVPGHWTQHRLALRGLVLSLVSAVAYVSVHWVQTVAGAVPTIVFGIGLTALFVLVRFRTRVRRAMARLRRR